MKVDQQVVQQEVSNNFNSPTTVIKEWIPACEEGLLPKEDLQRHGQSMANNKTSSSVPQLKTNRDMEKHAAQVYTFLNFYRFQDELWVACLDCEVVDMKGIDEGSLMSIANCSKKDGKLRWTKLDASRPIFDVDGNVLEGCSQKNHEDEAISKSWMEFLRCMDTAGRDPERHFLLAKRIESAEQELDWKGSASESKVQELESCIGSSAPSLVETHPPKRSNTKGTGTRIKGEKEQSMEQQKRKKLCIFKGFILAMVLLFKCSRSGEVQVISHWGISILAKLCWDFYLIKHYVGLLMYSRYACNVMHFKGCQIVDSSMVLASSYFIRVYVCRDD